MALTMAVNLADRVLPGGTASSFEIFATVNGNQGDEAKASAE